MVSQPDKEWIVAATCVFVIVLLTVAALMASPGECVTIYAIIASLTLLTGLQASRVRRVWALIATLWVLALLVRDNEKGRETKRRISDAELRQKDTNAKE